MPILISHKNPLLFEVLKETGIEKETVLKQKQTLILQKRPQITQLKQSGSRYVNGVVSRTATVAKFKQSEKKIQEAKIPGARLFIESAVGYPFGQFSHLDLLLHEGKTELRHSAGEVLLVCMWATWSKGSLKPMERIQEMLDNNEALWGNTVRAVAVNVDEKREDATAFITEHGWTKLQHLTINGWNKADPLLENFAIEGVPFIVLVDKFGKVDYEGDPNHLPLEGRIQELLSQQAEEEYQKQQAETNGFIEDFEDTENRLKELLTADKIRELFVSSELFCSKLIIQSIVLTGITSKHFSLELSVNEGDDEALQLIRANFESIPDLQVKINQVKWVEVPEVQSPSCYQCQTSLIFPYYWLKWEEGTQFGCLNCIEKPSQQPGHHYNYEQNSVLLTGRWKKIALKGLGNNLRPNNIHEFSKIHEFACNACEGGSPLGHARYICLGCRSQPNFNYDFVDFCQGCISHPGQEQVSKCFEKEMHCPSHPWLRVLYQAGSYLRF